LREKIQMLNKQHFGVVLKVEDDGFPSFICHAPSV